MRITSDFPIGAGLMAALLTTAAIALSPVAAASGVVTASGGDGTSVDRDGTQGDLAPAVQGIADDDGDQDAYLRASEQALPQFKAAQK